MVDINKDYVEDPEPGDEDDPSYGQEMFELFQALGITPADVVDPETSQEYALWLQSIAGGLTN